MKTYTARPSEVKQGWWLIDAEGVVLGRLASEISKILRGKNKPTFTPHVDTGDFVVVVNASKVVLSAGKAQKELRYRHSGYPGGLKSWGLDRLLEVNPEEVVRNAVRGMLPRTRLGRSQLSKLKVYAGPEHPHEAQQPVSLELEVARRAGGRNDRDVAQG